MTIVPITLKAANAYVRRCHRHSATKAGCRWCIGVIDSAGELRGVAICGRPDARAKDDGLTLEVLRLCTDGTPNLCSRLYRRCHRIAQQMGYRRFRTLTRQHESGASLRATGLFPDGPTLTDGGQWNCPSRPRTLVDEADAQPKLRWECAIDSP